MFLYENFISYKKYGNNRNYSRNINCRCNKSLCAPQSNQDKVELRYKVKPSGSFEEHILKNAPKPNLIFKGEEKIAKFVVDVTNNILYHYNQLGEAVGVYSVATGKPSTPTHTGYRMVTHVETYPYKTAPKISKRRKNPKSYGPKIICLEKIDLQTGEKGITGEFIHGNNNPASLGKKASHGCIRMDNEIIKYLSSLVKRGDFVIIKK